MASILPNARQNAEMLSRRLAYDPATGIVSWRDGRNAGQEAGTAGKRYRQITIDGVTYCSHVVAWLLHTGSFPPTGMDVDHRSRDKRDNRWTNLRIATRSQNKMNETERRGNTTGVKGAVWVRARRKWRLQMLVHRQRVHIGYFGSIEEARLARQAAERRLYGQFAPVREAARGI